MISTYTVRSAQSAEEKALYREVLSMVYVRGNPLEETASNFSEKEEGFVCLRPDGKPAGGYLLKHYSLSRGESFLPTGGIAAVGVMPHERGSGVGSLLMESSLEAMRERGLVLAALYPYREAYYRRFGYAQCGRRFQITVPTARFPKLESELECFRISPEDLSKLRGPYDSMAQRISGFHQRSDQDWTKRMGSKPPVIFALGDPAEAYVWTHYPENFWEKFEFGEFSWSTMRGYRSALALMRGLIDNQKSATWMEASNSPYLALYLDQGAEFQLHRPTMMRILDVPGAFSVLRHPVGLRVTIEIDDPQMPSNHGLWEIELGPDGSRCTRGSGPAVLRGSIRAWTQALMGEPSLAVLVECGAIEVLDPAQAPAIQLAFPAQPCMCSEFF